MVYLVKKTIKGKKYLYLEHGARVNGKPRRVFSIYLGPEENIQSKQLEIKQILDGNYDINTYDFGLPVALMQISERLDLINIIDKVTGKREQGLSVGQYTGIATLNRCIQPISKSKLKEWFYNTYLFNFFPTIDTYLNSMAYSNHFRYLTAENINKIELEIVKKLKTEFKLEMKHIMYDPTNFHTFINPTNQELPRHGHSKQGRKTLNIVNVSVFNTHDGGIPFMHQTYPGNIHDATHFKSSFPKFMQRLNKLGIKSNEITLVFDKGNISQEVFEEIDETGIYWITSIRSSSHKDLYQLLPKNFKKDKLPNKKEIGVLEFTRKMHKKDRRLIVIFNPRRSKWSKKNFLKKLKLKYEELIAFRDNNLNFKKWRSSEKVIKKVKLMLKSYSKYFEIEISGDFAQLTMSIRRNKVNIQNHLLSLGKGYYMTNHKDLSGHEVIWTYRQQYMIEKLFNYLKNPDMTRIMPMYHSKDDSIRGHIFTCVLGVLLLTLLQREVKRKYPELSIDKIIDLLSQIKVAEINFKNGKKGQRSFTAISEDTKKLMKFLDLEKHLK